MKQNGEGIVSGLKGTGNKGFALQRGRARAGSHGRLTATHRRRRRAAQHLSQAEIKEEAHKSLRAEFEKAGDGCAGGFPRPQPGEGARDESSAPSEPEQGCRGPDRAAAATDPPAQGRECPGGTKGGTA